MFNRKKKIENNEILYNGRIEININYKNKNIYAIEEIQAILHNVLTTLKNTKDITIEISEGREDKEQSERRELLREVSTLRSKR